MEAPFLTNRKPTEEQLRKLLSLNSENEPIRFAILGEISARAEYASQALLVTDSHLFSYCFENDTVSEKIAFADVDDIFNKRMYGNGVMRVRLKDESLHNVFRFNFTVAALCDATVVYVKSICDGELPQNAFEAVDAAFNKLLAVCPKCGRTLSAPGIPCIHCMNKKRLLKKLIRYIQPESPILIISVIISIITTAIALVPPLLTRSLVDTILPGQRRDMLLWVSVLLVAINIIRYALAALRGYMLRRSGNNVLTRIRCDVYEKAQHLPMRFYDKTSTGAVINRISGDTATLQSFMLRVTQEVVVQFFKLVGIIIVMLVINPKLTIFSLCPVPIVVIGSRIFRIKIAPF